MDGSKTLSDHTSMSILSCLRFR